MTVFFSGQNAVTVETEISHSLFEIEAAHRSGEDRLINPLAFEQTEQFVNVSKLLQFLEVIEDVTRLTLAFSSEGEPDDQVWRWIFPTVFELPEIIGSDVGSVIEA